MDASSNGEFNVAINLATAQYVSIKVMNVLGKIVSIKNLVNVTTGVYKIDMTDEAKGIYFVEIATDKEKAVKKITMLR